MRSCVCATQGSFTPVGTHYSEIRRKKRQPGQQHGLCPGRPQLPAGPRAPAALAPLRRTRSSSPRLPSSRLSNTPRNGADGVAGPPGRIRSGLGRRPPCLLSPRSPASPRPAARGPGRAAAAAAAAAPRGAGGLAPLRVAPGAEPPRRAWGEAGGGRPPPPTPTRTPQPPTPTLLRAPARIRGRAASGTRHLPTRLGQRRAGDLRHGSCLGRGWWGAGVGVGV